MVEAGTSLTPVSRTSTRSLSLQQRPASAAALGLAVGSSSPTSDSGPTACNPTLTSVALAELCGDAVLRMTEGGDGSTAALEAGPSVTD